MKKTNCKTKSTFFTDDPEVTKIITSLKEKTWKSPEHKISDVNDENGNLYVDLVMEGGGVLGMALVGYTYILEQMNIRFLGLGGTSAGAINALLLSALGGYYEEKSVKLLDIIKDKNFFDFVDGDLITKILIKTFLRISELESSSPVISTVLEFTFWPYLAILGLFGIIKIACKKGLNPGNSFLSWLEGILKAVEILNEDGTLKQKGILNILDLYKKRRANQPKLYIDNGPKAGEEYTYCDCKKFAVIAADISTETKARFPNMAELYWSRKEIENNISPARFVRASMSIPFFFYPYDVRNIPDAENDEIQKNHWKEWAGYGLSKHGVKISEGVSYPSKVTFVDGGINSNFPIDSFHKTDKFISSKNSNGDIVQCNIKNFCKISNPPTINFNTGPSQTMDSRHTDTDNTNTTSTESPVPSMPTFGIRLGYKRNKPEIIGNVMKLVTMIFNSARHIRDYDFLITNPDFNKLIAYADTDATGINWLKFNLSDDEKKALFICGARAAGEFLLNFDWTQYKLIRDRNPNTLSSNIYAIQI